MEGCASAINLNKQISRKRYKKLIEAMNFTKNAKFSNVKNLQHKVVGWKSSNLLFNQDYELVGYMDGTKVFNIVNEYIGEFINGYISLKDNRYESGEPILTTEANIEFYKQNPYIGFDVSFRLFGEIV